MRDKCACSVHECGRIFYNQYDLDRHFELRHGVKGKYGEIISPPKKPVADGGGFEQVYAAMAWERDLMKDQADELQQKADAVDEMLYRIAEAGGLDHNGKAKKKAPEKKATTKRSSGASKPAKKTAASKVGLPPSRGGTAPPGKPHWDKRAGRWTATTPKQERKSAAKKARQRYDADRETAELDGGGPVEEPEAPEQHADNDAPEVGKLFGPALKYVLGANKNGAPERWRRNAMEGCTDEELEQRINYELGEAGIKRGPDWEMTWSRVKGQTQVRVDMHEGGSETLSGRELLDCVRELLFIDARYGTPGEVAEQVAKSKKAV